MECCLCGYRFAASADFHHLEQCPKCRSRRLVYRFEAAETLADSPGRPLEAGAIADITRRDHRHA
jgi:predicted  nucleic acid-binding Zn-ribbon protein